MYLTKKAVYLKYFSYVIFMGSSAQVNAEHAQDPSLDEAIGGEQ